VKVFEVHCWGRLLTPAHQTGDQKTGSISMLRRLAFFVNGRREDIPVITGNSLRGKVRRLLARDLCSLLGYQPKANPLPGEGVYHFLFAGGSRFKRVAAKDAGQINLAQRERIRRLFPLVALLGASLGNQPFEGAARTGMFYPVCRELVGLGTVPAEAVERLGMDPSNLPSFRAFIDDTFHTQKDDLRDHLDDEDREKVQMIYNEELLVPGTPLWQKWVVQTGDPVVVSCFWRGVKLFLAQPYIGGGHARHYGEVQLTYGGYSPDLDAEYIKFVEDNADEIRAAVEELAKIC